MVISAPRRGGALDEVQHPFELTGARGRRAKLAHRLIEHGHAHSIVLAGGEVGETRGQ
jgi:hypothetical protein